MELVDYWRALWLRRGLILTLALATLAASTVFTLTTPPLYRTAMRVLVRAALPPTLDALPAYYSREYYNTLFAEYIQDDLSEILKSQRFARDVNAVLRGRYGEEYDEADIADSIATKKTHRTVKITIATPGADRTFRIADAAAEVIRQNAAGYFAQNDHQFVFVDLIDPPRAPMAPSLPRRMLDVLLQTSVAVVVGAAIALALRYLDDKIREPADVVRVLELPVLAALPREQPGATVAGAKEPRARLRGFWPADPRWWTRGVPEPNLRGLVQEPKSKL